MVREKGDLLVIAPTRRRGHAGDLGPALKGLAPGGSMLGGWNVMAAEQEKVVDPVTGGQEALRLAGWLEPFHLPLSPSCA
jgi:hypothetical protein